MTFKLKVKLHLTPCFGFSFLLLGYPEKKAIRGAERHFEAASVGANGEFHSSAGKNKFKNIFAPLFRA